MADLLERVWARLPKGGPDECWIWTGNVGQKGGPTISLGKRTLTTRRVIWEHVHGETLPRNRQVATKCKVPRCLNPAHLYLRPWMDDAARFWSHVEKGDGDACWIWKSTFFVAGYGAFKMQGKERQAHRVAWELTYGPIVGHIPNDPKAERVVMHKCDNPKCVRPDHLELGTDADNIADMWRKGRGSHGEKHATAMRKARARGVDSILPFTSKGGA